MGSRGYREQIPWWRNCHLARHPHRSLARRVCDNWPRPPGRRLTDRGKLAAACWPPNLAIRLVATVQLAAIWNFLMLMDTIVFDKTRGLKFLYGVLYWNIEI